MENLQSLSAKLGEVSYRKKLVSRHLGKTKKIPGEPDEKEILEILKRRIADSRKIFRGLISKKIALSPFLEIGAEKGQRSMLLVNEFGSQGYALDISRDSLLSAKKFAEKLGFSKLPTLVCADAYHLPFTDNCLPFVFCFETLHHFPDPAPIIKEIYRVLSPGGVFYFAEEPIKQNFNLNLWRRGFHLTFIEKLLKAIGLLPFLSRIGKNEVKEGILENEFGFSIWEKALEPFDQVEAKVKPVFFGPESHLKKEGKSWQNLKFFTRLLIAIQGGGIQAICYKSGQTKSANKPTILCPNCHKKLNTDYSCSCCQQNFRQKDGILMLLSKELKNKLYGN